eukprot:TRINITY_DN17944_c0_g1_i1.p1 TRINITY_DN17944_c0_g1~~TRINITY_DN17944_c0_g1_i1.p1  ORF type:complete len:270 (-),score=81.19 TRINITY_DN17944_c0_g1_i1:71-880(-)
MVATLVMVTTLVVAITFVVYMTLVHRKTVQSFLGKCVGLPKNKIRSLIWEIQRKSFHFVGLLLPGGYYLLMNVYISGQPLITKNRAVCIGAVIALCAVVTEFSAKLSPAARQMVIKCMGSIMRKEEINDVNKFSGAFSYSLGAFFSALLYTPTVTILSLLYLTVGDFFAALVGKAIGRTRLYGKKTLEGTLACFTACFVLGMMMLLHLRVPVFDAGVLASTGAVAAALAELFVVFDDNLSIPLASGFVLSATARLLGAHVPLPNDDFYH